MAVTLRELTDVNREAVLALHVTPEQERFVGGSVQNALADAAEYPQAKPWHRAVYAGEEPIGFVMISWNCEPQPPEIIGPWFLWKLLIDKRYQAAATVLRPSARWPSWCGLRAHRTVDELRAW
jgi:diamine N-acetyltransferase